MWRSAASLLLVTLCGACTTAPSTGTLGTPPDAAADGAAHVKCVTSATYTATCAYDPGCPVATDFATDILPAGACVESDHCAPIVRPLHCGCPRVPGAASFYDCRCVAGQWACTLTSQNGNVCEAPCHIDAGDAG